MDYNPPLIVLYTSIDSFVDNVGQKHIIILCVSVSLFMIIALSIWVRYTKLKSEYNKVRFEHQNLVDQVLSLSHVSSNKDKYIIDALYGNSQFVDRIERINKLLVRKIKAKQFSDLLDIVDGFGIRRERQRILTLFDVTFLKLFPNFITEYNNLFESKDAICIGENCELPTEVRIFALIKLGVENSAQIAKYLNISLNTVYVYKAKVKARTILPKEDLERVVKAIK